MLDNAAIRMGILARVSGFMWGLEAGALGMPADSLVTGLLRYGLAVVGSCAYEQPLARVDKAVINVTARRVLGVGRPARIPSPHSVAGARPINNLYMRRRAELLA